MSERYPENDLTEGHDCFGAPCRIGDIDSADYPVRYIDPSGLAHESRYAAYRDWACGEWEEQFRRFRMAETSEIPLPSPILVEVPEEFRSDIHFDMYEAAMFECFLRQSLGDQWIGFIPPTIDPSALWVA